MFVAIRVREGNGVAVAFLLFLVVEGFGVSEDDVRALAAGDGEFGIGGGEGFAVEQKMNMIGIDLEKAVARS